MPYYDIYKYNVKNNYTVYYTLLHIMQST